VTAPAEAVTLAAVALHDAECPDRTCGGAALGVYYWAARITLEAAAEVIRRDERDRVRRLAVDTGATCVSDEGTGCHFADLVGAPSPGHAYLSTSCLHAAEPGREDLHAYCQSARGRADGGETWAKSPACCKFCGAPCTCGCHRGEGGPPDERTTP
jgi:hypothetical protein